MRVKRQGSAVHGTAGWPGALPGPARRCTRSPESLQSRPGALRMSKPLRCSGHVHGRQSEGSDDRAAQPKTLRGRWCERTIAHPGALPPKPPAYRSGHREGEGVLSVSASLRRHRGWPGASCKPGRADAYPPSVRVGHRGRGSVHGTPTGKPGPYCPHPGAGTPRTERCRSHLRQWPCRMWRTFRLCRHRPGHPERIGHRRWVEVASHRPVEQQGF